MKEFNFDYIDTALAALKSSRSFSFGHYHLRGKNIPLWESIKQLDRKFAWAFLEGSIFHYDNFLASAPWRLASR